jgi:hypothetical protein
MGHHDVGKVGIVIEIITNEVGNTILTVNTGGQIKNWYSDFVRVLNECR